MFSNKMTALILFFLCCCGFSPRLSAQSDFYAVIVHLSKPEKKQINRYQIDKPQQALKKNIKIQAGQTILTMEDQSMEMVLYQNDQPVAMIFLNENTDMQYHVTAQNTVDLHLTYGQIRVVVKKKSILNLKLKQIKINVLETDFAATAYLSGHNQHHGEIYVFKGLVQAGLNNNESQSQLIREWQKAAYSHEQIYAPIAFTEKELHFWQQTMSKQAALPPEQIKSGLILESLAFQSPRSEPPPQDADNQAAAPDPGPESDVQPADVTDDHLLLAAPAPADATSDLISDATDDQSKKLFLKSLLSLESGVIYIPQAVTLHLAYTPGFSRNDDFFEFRFYLPFQLTLTRLASHSFLSILYSDNLEWTFGSDQNQDAGKIVYDIFNDTLSKIDRIRINHENALYYVNIGEKFDLSDQQRFSLNHFHLPIFYPLQRSTSFFSQINLNFFKCLFYGEELMPEGIYATDFSFMNPAKSFKVTFGGSVYFDFYDLHTYIQSRDRREVFMPGQFNGRLLFTIFNLPSFGLSVYALFGFLLPFSYNYITHFSYFNTLVSVNPNAVLAALNLNIGLSIRIKKIILASEFIMDSDINKISLFDPLYQVRRQKRNTRLTDWMNDLIARPVSIRDFHFGARFKLEYQLARHIDIDSSYQVTFTYNETYPTLVEYYDKLGFNLSLDSRDIWPVNIGLKINWAIEKIGTSLMFLFLNQYQELIENNVLFCSAYLKPLPSLKIELKYGLYPAFNQQEQVHLEHHVATTVTIRPVKKKKTDRKS